MVDDEPNQDEEEGEALFKGEEDEVEEVEKEPAKRKRKTYFDEIYGEELGGEGMQYYPPPSDLDLLMGSDTRMEEPMKEESKVGVEAEEREEFEEEEKGEEIQGEFKEEEEEQEEEVEAVERKEEEEGERGGEVMLEEQHAKDKESITTIGSFEFKISEYFVKPREKTPSELQFEADYREIIEAGMKQIMEPVADSGKIEEREPVQKKKLLITDVDVSGLYPPPKVIESEMSFAFDEDEEIEKAITGISREIDVTQYIMDVVRDSLKHDPDSIFTKNQKDAIQKMKNLVEDIVGNIKRGILVDFAQKVNESLANYKPNLRNTLIIRLKEKLEKSEVFEEEEEEGKAPAEVDKKEKKIKKKKAKQHKVVEKIQEEYEEEEEEGEGEEVIEGVPEEVKPVEVIKEFGEKEEQKEEEEEGKMEEEKIVYEKINWLQFLTESEQKLDIDPKIRSEMELYIALRKDELAEQKQAIAEKKASRVRYTKAKDPQLKLKYLNLNVTMKFILNTGNIFTCAYRYFLPFGEIKEDLSGIFKVPSDVLIIYRGEVEVKDDETAFDLKPEIEPFDSVTFRLLTLDNDRWVLRSDHLELPTPDILTITVDTGKDHLGVPEYKDVVVEIENRKIKKPFVGGYRDCETGVEYHHAFTQSAPHAPKLPWDKRVSRDTQTAFTNAKLIDTDTDKSTQVYRRDLYITTEYDKIVTPKPYVDYETWYKERDIEGKVKTIQRYIRAMILRRFLKKMSKEYRRRKCWEIEQEKRRIIERENRIKTDIINMTYPQTKTDFDMLYALVEKWRKAQIERISNLKTEAPRKAELCTVLEKEIKLLEAIEVHRIAVSKKQKRIKALNFMNKVAKPLTWTGYRGMTIKMDTLKTQRARELKELYQSLSRHELNPQDRIELLVSLKYALRVDPTGIAEELGCLINQECEMLIRGAKGKDLEYLRQRIEHLFAEYFKNPNFNPEAAKYDPRFNKEPFKNNFLFCKLCHQMKLLQNFSATGRDRSVNVCSACQWLHNIAIPRVDLNPYRYILKLVRKDEQKRNCYSSCAFVLQDEDMRFLVTNIWRNRSAVSENDNLLDLRMPRWNVNEDWTPWNCILLTELEAKAHLKTKPEDNYEPQLLGEIVSKQEMAKRRFRQLLHTTNRLRDSGKWENVVDVKDYQMLPVTADIPDLTPGECLRIKDKRSFYEVHKTRRKDFGYVEYI